MAIRTDLHRPREQRVRAGDVIGYVGAPATGAFKRLYFELWSAIATVGSCPSIRVRTWPA